MIRLDRPATMPFMTSVLRNACAAFVVALASAASVGTFSHAPFAGSDHAIAAPEDVRWKARRPGAQCTSGSLLLVPRYHDAAQFRTAAQAIVNTFAAQVSRARGGALADAPIVEVRNTPQLISFLRSSNTIVVPWWETQPAETRAVFRTFARGGDAEAEGFFRAFFNRFVIAHEAAHWFQARADRREATLYENENMANRIAVAFWRTQPEGECFLAELERLAAQAAANLPDPTPAGESPIAYFGANYQTLGRDPLKYGYYQFRFMADALRDRSQLDFARIVSAANSQSPHPGNPVLPGWYADPEAHVFDGKYWVYPTYSAPYDQQVFMDAFSSTDLVTWERHPRVLEIASVKWARRALWAPSIVEKDGWYYLFFGANDIQNDQQVGGIGVARSRRPEGPFEDHLGKPLIDKFHNGAQPIDQYVFRDHDGSYYIVYGGAFCQW